jgi:diadenosine tetraphosphate (Ap4A) HIT family hydrolase
MTSICLLCRAVDEEILYATDLYRIILVNDPAWPGFCRVILNHHAAEMTDLPMEQRSALMEAVCVTESALRDLMAPTKINLASLGNVVPHVHWHVIPRWSDDSHFPDPIWANHKRAWPNKPVIDRTELIARLRSYLDA